VSCFLATLAKSGQCNRGKSQFSAVFYDGIPIAPGMSMMTAMCILGALAAAAFFTEMIALSTAPVGYQDETGFHFGQPSLTAFELEHRS
jgi:hypothetical protein